jgi:hypothetical protein
MIFGIESSREILWWWATDQTVMMRTTASAGSGGEETLTFSSTAIRLSIATRTI